MNKIASNFALLMISFNSETFSLFYYFYYYFFSHERVLEELSLLKMQLVRCLTVQNRAHNVALQFSFVFLFLQLSKNFSTLCHNNFCGLFFIILFYGRKMRLNSCCKHEHNTFINTIKHSAQINCKTLLHGAFLPEKLFKIF